MSEKTMVETIYGKYHKFEILREPAGVLTGPKFWIHRDGKPYRGSFSTLAAAVAAAKEQG